MSINFEAGNGFVRNKAQWTLQGGLGNKAQAFTDSTRRATQALTQDQFIHGAHNTETRDPTTGKYERLEKGYTTVLEEFFTWIANLFGRGAPKTAPGDPGAGGDAIPTPAGKPAGQIAPGKPTGGDIAPKGVTA
ncbi:MAG TPA: hypothetical protein VMD02_00020 [Candidatus Omnitrophota bacterium]|nr:hypothetical protein [Candidatus Omnitrophota bacterium]